MDAEEPTPAPLMIVSGRRVGLRALRRELIPTSTPWGTDLEAGTWQQQDDVADRIQGGVHSREERRVLLHRVTSAEVGVRYRPPVKGASPSLRGRNRNADQISSTATCPIGRIPCSPRIGQRVSRLMSARLALG
jgi:hypothetical protein